MDKKKVTAFILLDFAKAFDSVSHPILLHKLSCVGASPDTVKWFSSYVSGRSQSVRILQPLLHFPSPMAYQTELYYHPDCFVFTWTTCHWLHNHMIWLRSLTIQKFISHLPMITLTKQLRIWRQILSELLSGVLRINCWSILTKLNFFILTIGNWWEIFLPTWLKCLGKTI